MRTWTFLLIAINFVVSIFCAVGTFFIWHSAVGLIIPFTFYIGFSLLAFCDSREPLSTVFIKRIDRISNKILTVISIVALAVTLPTVIFAVFSIPLLVLLFVIIKANIYISFFLYKYLNRLCETKEKDAP
jgi:hypothetical protein